MPDIVLVILYWVLECEIEDAWQRIGRAARNQRLQGTALILAKKKHYDEVKEQREKNKAKKEEQKRKRQADSEKVDESTPPSKRQKVAADSATPTGTVNMSGAQDVPSDLLVEFDAGHEDSEDESDSDEDDIEPTSDDDGHQEEAATEHLSHNSVAQDAITGDAIFPMPDKEILEKRRAVYLETARQHKVTQPQKKPKGKAPAKEPGPELLDMVNTRRRKLMCRRIPVKLAFNSDQAGEYYLPNRE